MMLAEPVGNHERGHTDEVERFASSSARIQRFDGDGKSLDEHSNPRT
jgi:hypothetical protein